MAAGTTGPARSREQEAAFASLVEGQSDVTRALAERARAVVLEVMPGAIESIWPKQGTASYGTGPRKMSEHYCYFTLAKAHLGFGFYYGADLDDPEGLLEGSGKKMRRVKIRDLAQLDAPAFRALVEAASTHLVPPLES